MNEDLAWRLIAAGFAGWILVMAIGGRRVARWNARLGRNLARRVRQWTE